MEPPKSPQETGQGEVSLPSETEIVAWKRNKGALDLKIEWLVKLFTSWKEKNRGNLAQMRRMRPGDSKTYTDLFRSLATRMDLLTEGEDPYLRASMLLCCLSRGWALHVHGLPMGGVMARQGFSMLRLQQLVRTGPHTFVPKILGLNQFLIGKGGSFDYGDMGRAIYDKGTDREEPTNHKIIKDYQRGCSRAA